ncbi:MAG: hypothetical protein ACRC85_02940 [Kluyvera ascorbata]
MQTFTRIFIPIVSLLSVLTTGALAANSGVIHFRGQIVESPCDYQTLPGKVGVSCYQDGKTRHQSVPIHTLLDGRQFVNEKSTANLRWIDKDKKTAVLTVEYK